MQDHIGESIVFLNYTRTLAVIGLIRWMIILGSTAALVPFQAVLALELFYGQVAAPFMMMVRALRRHVATCIVGRHYSVP
jgi:hypothetical protein